MIGAQSWHEAGESNPGASSPSTIFSFLSRTDNAGNLGGALGLRRGRHQFSAANSSQSGFQPFRLEYEAQCDGRGFGNHFGDGYSFQWVHLVGGDWDHRPSIGGYVFPSESRGDTWAIGAADNHCCSLCFAVHKLDNRNRCGIRHQPQHNHQPGRRCVCRE
jgi:hypothetical protein